MLGPARNRPPFARASPVWSHVAHTPALTTERSGAVKYQRFRSQDPSHCKIASYPLPIRIRSSRTHRIAYPLCRIISFPPLDHFSSHAKKKNSNQMKLRPVGPATATARATRVRRRGHAFGGRRPVVGGARFAGVVGGGSSSRGVAGWRWRGPLRVRRGGRCSRFATSASSAARTRCLRGANSVSQVSSLHVQLSFHFSRKCGTHNQSSHRHPDPPPESSHPPHHPSTSRRYSS